MIDKAVYLKEILDSWDRNYGHVIVYKDSNSHFENYYVEFYNGGWSENEYLGECLVDQFARYIVINKHPCVVLEFTVPLIDWLVKEKRMDFWAKHLLEQEECREGKWEIDWFIKEEKNE